MILICTQSPTFPETHGPYNLRTLARMLACPADAHEPLARHKQGTNGGAAPTLEERRRRMLRDTEHYLSDPASEAWVRLSGASPDEPLRLWRVLPGKPSAARCASRA